MKNVIITQNVKRLNLLSLQESSGSSRLKTSSGLSSLTNNDRLFSVCFVMDDECTMVAGLVWCCKTIKVQFLVSVYTQNH